MIATDVGLRIQFKHHENRVTECFLIDESGTTVCCGEALCHSLDQFSRSVGRKLALSRALRSSLLSKATRTSVWESYFARKGENPDYD